MHDHTWDEAHEFETNWWGDCVNTYLEEEKQLKYAPKMGLEALYSNKVFFNLKGKSVLDRRAIYLILLLKCENKGYCVVLDPLKPPKWVLDRYKIANIRYIPKKAETMQFLLGTETFDEVWIYNCLQHVANPKKIIENAKDVGKVIRIFEWIDTPAHPGHPQTLKEEELNKWLGGIGKVEDFSEDFKMSYAKAYFGVFPTKHYAKS